MRDSGLERIETIAQLQERLPAEGDNECFLFL